MPFDEEWRPVRGYEGLYEVSSLGRIKSLCRTTTRINGRPLPIKERILRQNGVGHMKYLAVALNDGKIQRSARVHCVVLNAFVGDRPAGKQARHLDGNRLNNSVHNLAWGTAEENMSDKWEHGNMPIGSKCTFAKLNDEKARAIKILKEKTLATIDDLASLFDVSDQCVRAIVAGRSWRHV
jgi:hypothetical protein